jgi:nucleotide-binding universal stress UspA family protein
MKKILCPTDFSDTAHTAIAYAAKLAGAMQADLTLLNVQSLFDFTPVQLVEGKTKSVEQAARALEAQSLEVSRVFKISCYAKVESSYKKLSAVINDKAKGFDLLVMGSNGPDDLYQFFTGSNTYNAIRKADIPLLLIPPGFTFSEIRSVVYAFDYLQDRDLPMIGLRPLLERLDCDLTVLQVLDQAYSKDREDDLKEMQYILKTYNEDIDYQFDTIRSNDITQSINSYVLRTQTDVLALCSLHRNVVERFFHKSVIEGLSGYCTYPLYVFHQ